MHLESYLSALQIKSFACLFDDSFFFSQWKNVEKIFVDRNMLCAILLSNMKPSSKVFKTILPLRSLTVAYALLQNFKDDDHYNNSDTFLWFNKFLKYKGKPLHIEEFLNAGIVDAQQLVDANGNFRQYDDIAVEHNLTPNNESFIKFIQLISGIPENWQLSSAFVNNRNEIFESILENFHIFGKSTKSCYCYLFSKLNSNPTKQQLRWNQDLNLTLETED